MPKLLGVQFSKKLAVRLVVAIILGVLSFLVFYFIPSNLPTILPLVVAPNVRRMISTFLLAVVDKNLSSAGLFITLLILLYVLLYDSKVHGYITALLGLSFVAYAYLLFHGGSISIEIPEELIPRLSGVITLDLKLIMALFMLPGFLITLKGILEIVESSRGEAKRVSGNNS
ncbi:MAG: hypothetical protein ACPLW8_03720 [Candidatus Bathyarchaeales archaeon]